MNIDSVQHSNQSIPGDDERMCDCGPQCGFASNGSVKPGVIIMLSAPQNAKNV